MASRSMGSGAEVEGDELGMPWGATYGGGLSSETDYSERPAEGVRKFIILIADWNID